MCGEQKYLQGIRNQIKSNLYGIWYNLEWILPIRLLGISWSLKGIQKFDYFTSYTFIVECCYWFFIICKKKKNKEMIWLDLVDSNRKTVRKKATKSISIIKAVHRSTSMEKVLEKTRRNHTKHIYKCINQSKFLISTHLMCDEMNQFITIDSIFIINCESFIIIHSKHSTRKLFSAPFFFWSGTKSQLSIIYCIEIQ